nr:hypothetical protein [Cohnella algarum]
MIRKSPLRLLILAFPLLLAGCWDSKELNSIGIVAATAIDRSEDRWVVSFQVIIPQSIATQTGGGGAGNQSPITIFSTRGRTPREAMQLSSSETSRELFFSHNTSLIISEQVARDQGVGQILDMFLRPAESRTRPALATSFIKISEGMEPAGAKGASASNQFSVRRNRRLSYVYEAFERAKKIGENFRMVLSVRWRIFDLFQYPDPDDSRPVDFKHF